MKHLTFLLSFFVILACEAPTELSKLEDPLKHLLDPSLKPFYYGVASGDPLQDAVIIWTKVSPEDSLKQIEVEWNLATTDQFDEIVAKGTVTTSPDDGYTVKVDVKGLTEGTRYYYRFIYNEQVSMIGRTITATHESAKNINLAVVSCSNYEFGPFNAYGAIAERNDLNAVLHLGDYIYEYGERGYGDTTTGRFHFPKHEIVSLLDYRTRYAQYRTDADLREAHQMHPFITIWDDHEIANNSYKTGAQNHQSEKEGDYEVRKATAKKAYYEWLPVRPGKELYRSFDYGNIAQLIMLDERLTGRTAPVASVSDPIINREGRAMLGDAQLSWFKEQLSNSNATWKIIGNQVIFSYLDWGYPNYKLNMDSWDGYPGERAAILDYFEVNEIDNVVFVTGDTHSSWALEVTDDPFGSYAEKGALAVEYGTTSVNSANSNEEYGTTDEMVIEHEQNITGAPSNPQLKYTNMRDHGYLELSLSPERASATWYYTPSRVIPSREMIVGMEKVTPVGSNQVLDRD